MKILYYNHQLGCFDGSNSHAAGMLKALRKIHGEENVLVANRVCAESSYSHTSAMLKQKLGLILDPLKVARRKKLSVEDARYAIEVARRSDFSPDVLLARSPLYDEAPIVIAKELGCKLILEANTPLFYECCDVRKMSMRSLVKVYEKKMLDASAGIYCVSEEVRDMLEEEYGGVFGKAFVVPNGYDSELFSDIENRDEIRRVIRDSECVSNKFVITFVGSLQAWHGIPRLLEIASIAEKFYEGMHFWVLGDGPERESVRAYSEEHGNLSWFGNVGPDRMKELLYSSDLGIMPYNKLEHFYFSPLKMYDMIGARLPFLGYKTGQIETAAKEYGFSNLFLIDSQSANKYADAIASICSSDHDYRKMGQAVGLAAAKCCWDQRALTLTREMERVL